VQYDSLSPIPRSLHHIMSHPYLLLELQYSKRGAMIALYITYLLYTVIELSILFKKPIFCTYFLKYSHSDPSRPIINNNTQRFHCSYPFNLYPTSGQSLRFFLILVTCILSSLHSSSHLQFIRTQPLLYYIKHHVHTFQLFKRERKTERFSSARFSWNSG